MKSKGRSTGSRLGFIAGVASAFFGRSRKPTGEDLRRADFKTSTQRMGVRFTEKMRNVFRSKWLKKS